MSNLSLNFTNPWFLLLIVPAALLTLLPYFKIQKKYRRTRNRIVSMVLHLTVFLLCTLILAGLTFVYNVPNPDNEIILLVDVSETEAQSADDRDEFLQTVIERSRGTNCKIAVVTFGYDQKYAVPFTDDIDDVFPAYQAAEKPDTSATNIADALTYSKELFSNAEAGKIVLISDGKETDNEALNVIRSVVASGIKVDTVSIPSEYDLSNSQIVNATLPDYHVEVGEVCFLSVDLQSTQSADAIVRIYDNDEEDALEMKTVSLSAGTQTVSFQHTFQTHGLHKLTFKLEATPDDLEQNNVFNTYFYLDVYNNVLVIESVENDSEILSGILTEGNEFNVTVKNVHNADDVLPATVDELREYDQVILNNIATTDLPEGFQEILYTYVNVYGGGMFTVGGTDEGGNVHSYDPDDLSGSVLQQIMPVQAIEYTPPVGVMFIIDTSGSMSESTSGRSYLEWAKSGAQSCLNVLTERDWVGIMTLDDQYDTVLEMTKRTQEAKILAAIETIEEAVGGTVYPGAIERAGEKLRGCAAVSKRHIILVTDGGVPEAQKEQYESLIDEYYKNDGITFSVVLIGVSESSEAGQLMKAATDLGHGRLIAISKGEDAVRMMREECNAPDIKDMNYEDFYPLVTDKNAAIYKDVAIGTEAGAVGENNLTVQLSGFFGTKIKSGADLLLTGDYEVPVYAQWKFGKGSVGSFMCDLSAGWSGNFVYDSNGRQIVKNIVKSLMPVEDIRPSPINAMLREQNYTNRLEIYNVNEGETIEGTIVDYSSDEEVKISLNSVTENRDLGIYVTTPLSAGNGFGRANFVIKKGGSYGIVLKKYDASGNLIGEKEIFKTFSYSAEYDTFAEQDESKRSPEQVISLLAKNGNGRQVEDLEDPWEIFADFVSHLNRVYDPRTLFMILSIALFLLDIAVRKFKFKWIHELIRERKGSDNQAKK